MHIMYYELKQQVQGLIRRFQHVVEDRIAHPEAYKPEQYFQPAWSGDGFTNTEWAQQHGDGKTYTAKATR
jgi:hypothetical protein